MRIKGLPMEQVHLIKDYRRECCARYFRRHPESTVADYCRIFDVEVKTAQLDCRSLGLPSDRWRGRGTRT